MHTLQQPSPFAHRSPSNSHKLGTESESSVRLLNDDAPLGDHNLGSEQPESLHGVSSCQGVSFKELKIFEKIIRLSKWEETLRLKKDKRDIKSFSISLLFWPITGKRTEPFIRTYLFSLLLQSYFKMTTESWQKLKWGSVYMYMIPALVPTMEIALFISLPSLAPAKR